VTVTDGSARSNACARHRLHRIRDAAVLDPGCVRQAARGERRVDLQIASARTVRVHPTLALLQMRRGCATCEHGGCATSAAQRDHITARPASSMGSARCRGRRLCADLRRALVHGRAVDAAPARTVGPPSLAAVCVGFVGVLIMVRPGAACSIRRPGPARRHAALRRRNHPGARPERDRADLTIGSIQPVRVADRRRGAADLVRATGRLDAGSLMWRSARRGLAQLL